MLGKEDVLLWFKDLESYKRIEVMYELLNMCIPFELRFLGSCIEEIGKHSYQELRGPSIVANDPERLAKDSALRAGLADEGARHRAVIYMSVLSARNCTCANWYYRTLLRPAEPRDHAVNVLSGREPDLTNVISELLLFYTLGLYHPAFTFEQKNYFREALQALNSTAAVNAVNAVKVVPLATTSEVAVQVPPQVPRNLAVNVSNIESNQQQQQQQQSVVMPVVVDQNVKPKLQNFLFPSGPPEARPFPAQTRRELSPPPSPLLAIPLLDTIVAVPPPLHLESNPAIPPPIFNPPLESLPKNIDEENHFISEEQIAKQNGIRYIKSFHTPPHEQFASLKIDPDKPPSNSSSSCSSRNHSPTETPSATPAVTPHGPGRGPPPPDGKPRVNGMPPPPPPSLRLVDPPQYSAVPSYPPSFPARYYPFRHPFPQSYHAVPNEILFNFPMYYSSVPQPPRNPNCCNCGGLGHTAVECTSQSVEDITQTPYKLDFESPDNPPDK